MHPLVVITDFEVGTENCSKITIANNIMKSNNMVTKFSVWLIFLAGLFQISMGQNMDVVLVGATMNKALFYLRGKTYFSEEMCTFRGMYAGSIDTEEENTMLSTFIQETLHDSVWIAATDYAEEGDYRQIRTGISLNYTNWNESASVQDLERNCLIMNSEGELEPEYCHFIYDTSLYHHPLCETPLYGHLFRDHLTPTESKTRKTRAIKPSIAPGKRQSQPIGSIGSKSYYQIEADDGAYFHRALDYCHMDGRRLLTLTNEQETDFILDYVRNNISDMILTSVTDLITPNCESPMSYYRNFYTGEIFEYEGESHGYRALVVAMTPAGLTFTSYISGGGRYIICEEEGELERPCGLVGYNPDEIIRNEVPLNINLLPGTEFWRATPFNVNSTATISHPHNRYVSALRTSTAYYLETTADTVDFISAEETDTILRTSLFYCNDSDEVVRYNFEIKVEGGTIYHKSNE